MSTEIKLPKGWELKKLGEIADYLNGRAFRKTEWEKSGKPIIRIQNLNKLESSYNYTNKVFEDRYKVEKDDLLFSWAASLGVYFWNGESAWLNQHIFKVIPNDDCNKKFLYYSLNKIIQELYSKTHGSGMVHVTKSKFEQTQIPFPPLREQFAIVSKIEQLFSELDKSIENLKTAQQQLKMFRQSVLKWAFEGKLTNKKVREGELPKGWEWKKSGDFFSFVTSGSRGWAKYYSHQGAIFIRITNLDFDSLELDLGKDKIQYVNPPVSSEGIRTKVQEGDFLFSITGYLGMFAIAPRLNNAYVNQHICLCRPKTDFNKKFLGYWIVSRSGGHHYLNKNQKGAVKAGLNLDELKTFPVPICHVDEQNKIVHEIEKRLTIADKLEESITQNLRQAEVLRQSILKKAFSGEQVNEVATETIEKIHTLYKPKNEYFYQLQVLGLIAKASKSNFINHGEMTLAKYAYLIDKIYGIPTFYDYQRWHLGPFPPTIKKVFNNREYFQRVKGEIELVNESKLLKYSNQYQSKVEKAINELAFIFSKYDSKERAHKTELLATVCKVIEDIQSTDLKEVRKSMKNWEIKLKATSHKNKAEKFSEAETKKCLIFIVEKGWDKKLIISEPN